MAAPAFAATLALTPGAGTVNVINTGNPVTAGSTSGYSLVQSLSDSTFSTRVVTSSVSALTLSIDSFTAPSGVTLTGTPYLYWAEKAAGGSTGPTANTTNGPWTRVDVSTGLPATASLTGSSSAATRDVFFAGSQPGTYKFKFVDPGPTAGTDDDSTSGDVNLVVKDAYAATAATSDDWAPTVSNSVPSAGIGAPLVGSVALSSLTLIDARGSSSGVGVLQTEIKDLVGLKFTGAGLAGAPTTSTAVSSTGTRSLAAGATAAAGTLTTTVAYDRNGDATLTDVTVGTATTTVASNAVTAVALDATDVAGSVKETSGAVAAKTGTATVTYTATVTDADADKSGNVVYFTIAGSSANVAKLTTDGTSVDVTSATSRIYSATTDSSGVATLEVTSSDPSAGTYTVDATSNAQSGSQLTTTYAAASAASFEVTNPTTELYPTVGATSVTLKGKLLDQLGGSFQPASSASQQVTVTVDASASTCGTYASADSTGFATITDGLFSFTYSPTTALTAGQCDVFRYAYTGATSLDTSLRSASAATVSTVTLTTPKATVAAANLSKSGTIAPNQSDATTGSTGGSDATDYGSSTGEVTGTALDAASAGIAYKKVTVTGGDGVYFSTASSGSDLKTSLDVITNSSGAFSGAYAFFTKAGTVKVTATAGGIAKDASVSTDASADPYVVSVDPASGSPGSTLILTGKVKDAFGNPVPSATVNLSTDDPSLGSLGATSVTTTPTGAFTTTFVSGSNQTGGTVLTATLNSQTADATPAAGWLASAKLTLPTGDYQDTAQITLATIKPTVNAPSKDLGGGKVKLTGTYKADSTVDIYSKPSGAGSYSLIDTVETDGDGDWSKFVTIKKTTSFLVRADGISSRVDTVVVKSTVKLHATSPRKGKVKLYANGTPAAKGKLTFYRVVSGPDKKVGSKMSNSGGNGSIRISAPKGKRTYKVIFKATGTSAGSDADRVTVKK